MNRKLLRRQSVLFLVCMAALAFGAAPSNAGSKTANVPFSLPYYTYTVESGIVYGQGVVYNGAATKDLKLDLYKPDIPPPASGINQFPLMVMIHGGGFIYGDETSPDVVPAAQEYATRGWLVATIDYRKIQDYPVPSSRVQALYDYLGGASATSRNKAFVSAIDDTLTALDFLYLRSDVKPEWTTLWGSSSGGNIALATTYALDDHGIPRPQIALVVDVAGRFDGSAIDNPFDSPLSDPALMDIIGTADDLYQYSLQTQAWAIAAGLPLDFEEIEGAGHTPDLFNSVSSTGVILFQRTVDWHHETVFDGLEEGPQPPVGGGC